MTNRQAQRLRATRRRRAELGVERVSFESEDRDVLGAEDRDRHRNGDREAQNEAGCKHDQRNHAGHDVCADEMLVGRNRSEPRTGSRPDEHGRNACR